ncbi:MAG: endonuclease/exonuclease/phosphatase family protein, partial [Planctomycetaceae bacterium]
MRFRRFLLTLAAACGAFFALSTAWAEDAPAPVRVMSFNIRYGTANDGANHWDRRREFLKETITAFDPDLLGTQETLRFQRDWLADQLPGYGVLGVGRDDGREAGEMMALYYREARFEKLDGGHFWLSESPERPGSKSWDSALPRMVTWVKLRDRQAPESSPIRFFNTHFDHQGQVARRQSALLIRRRLEERARDCALIITGDFNDGEGGEPYRSVFEPQDGRLAPVIDTFRTHRPERSADEGTFSDFKASQTQGARIDWIGASRDWHVLDAAIDHTSRDGRTPSDHFPVTAVLERTAQPQATSSRSAES